MLDTILSLRPFSSFTQTSSESKKIYMAKDSIWTVLCQCTSLFRIEQRMQAYPWFDMNVGSFELLLINNSPTPWILPWWTPTHQPQMWSWWFGTTSLQLQMCGRWANHSVLSYGLSSTGPPSTGEYPFWMIFQQGLSGLLPSLISQVISVPLLLVQNNCS